MKPRILKYEGRTQAYTRFRQNHHRTRLLLSVGLFGLSEQLKISDGILDKMKDIPPRPGPIPKDHSPVIEAARLSSGEIRLSLDERTAQLLKRSFAAGFRKQKDLRFHLYSIIAVHLWGTFETYLGMLFQELYALRPELLSSNQTITYQEAVRMRNDLVEFLTERQIDRLQHFTLAEWTKYLEDRIGLKISMAMKSRLEELYFIRNIVAHNTGVLRPSQVANQANLPVGTSAVGGELRITKQFLIGMLDRMEGTVEKVEKHVEKKFYLKNVGRSVSRPR